MADKEELEKDASSSDSSDSDEEMEEAETALFKKLETVKKQLIDQPESYDLLVERIQILQSLGELKELRSAREALSKLYPLTPELWLSWIQDESNLVTDLEGKEDIIELFERAVKDYQSVKVWLLYIQHMRDMGEQEEDILKCRVVLERAVAAVGLHVTQGHLIWEAYRNFEIQFLSDDSTMDQKARCSALCFRQLSVPLIEIENVYNLIKSLFTIDAATDKNYQSSVEKLKSLEEWENQLEAASNSTTVYREYIQYEKQEKSNPARIVCLYERAVCDNALDSSLWLEFINYVSNELKISSVVLDLTERATRNCPWDVSIWIQFLHEVEKFTQSKEKIREIFERGIVYCTTGDQAGNLWLNYIQSLRRRINFQAVLEEDVELFMKTLTTAEEYLNQLSPEPREHIGEILMFGIRLQAHTTKSMVKTRKLWYQALHKGYGQQFKLWVQFFQLEQRYGDINSSRKCLEKAMSAMEESLEVVAELWLNFERDFGDLNSVKHAEEKITEFWNKKYQAQAQQLSISKKSKFQNEKQKRSRPAFKQNYDGPKDRGPKRQKFPSDSTHPEQQQDKNDEFKKPYPSQNFEQKTARRPPKSFVPRSLQIQPPKNPTSADGTDADKKSTDAQVFKKPMTNEDFRNLLKK